MGFERVIGAFAVKVGIPEFLNGIGKGVETHSAKLESEIGDFQRLLVTRTLKLKKLGIPCKHVSISNFAGAFISIYVLLFVWGNERYIYCWQDLKISLCYEYQIHLITNIVHTNTIIIISTSFKYMVSHLLDFSSY